MYSCLSGVYSLVFGSAVTPAPQAIQQKSAHKENLRPLVVCGPSGVGKGTLLKRLFAEYPDKFGFSVSHTTRKPRPGEQNGVNYHFCTREQMLAGIAAGQFIETAEFSGNLYGSSIEAVKTVADQGKICVLEIDVQGAQSVKKTDLNARFVFVKPPSREILEERLRGRGTETEEEIKKRLEAARKELDFCDSSDLFELVIVNDDLKEAYTQLKEFVL